MNNGNFPLRVLFYGFGPFAEVERNSSEAIVRYIAARPPYGVVTRTLVLPVVYRTARARLLSLLAEDRFDLVLGFGVAVAAATARIECAAYNRVDRVFPDGEGLVPMDAVILPEGPPSLPARLDCHELRAAVEAAGVTAVLSDDPGCYLCNYAFYLTLALVAPQCRAAFVHVPLSIAPETGRSIAMAAVDCLREQRRIRRR